MLIDPSITTDGGDHSEEGNKPNGWPNRRTTARTSTSTKNDRSNVRLDTMKRDFHKKRLKMGRRQGLNFEVSVFKTIEDKSLSSYLNLEKNVTGTQYTESDLDKHIESTLKSRVKVEFGTDCNLSPLTGNGILVTKTQSWTSAEVNYLSSPLSECDTHYIPG